MRDDIFLPFDAEGNYADSDTIDSLEYLGYDGQYYVYASDKPTTTGDGVNAPKKERKKFFSKVFGGLKDAFQWTKKMVTQWGKDIRERRNERRKTKNDLLRKEKEIAEKKANERGLTGSEKEKYVLSQLNNKVPAIEKAANSVEQKLVGAEAKAYEQTLKATNDKEAAEKAALEAGQKAAQQILATGTELEKQIVGGTAKDINFWQSLGTGGKIAIIAGGAIVLFLGVYAIVKASKSK
jgi:CHASE3 domain sensor protein